MDVNFKINARDILVQIMDGVRVSDLPEKNKDLAEIHLNGFIKAILTPQHIVGEGAKQV